MASRRVNPLPSSPLRSNDSTRTHPRERLLAELRAILRDDLAEADKLRRTLERLSSLLTRALEPEQRHASRPVGTTPVLDEELLDGVTRDREEFARAVTEAAPTIPESEPEPEPELGPAISQVVAEELGSENAL